MEGCKWIKIEKRILYFMIITNSTWIRVASGMWLISIFMPSEVLHLMPPNATFSLQNLNYFRIIISIVPLLCVVLTAMTF